MKKLNDTIPMMISLDYKERFKAEYWQTKIRYQRLHEMLVNREAGQLPFTPGCPIDLLKKQKDIMGEYLFILEVRAKIEDIDLKEETPLDKALANVCKAIKGE